MTQLALFDEGPPPPCPADFNLARYVLAAGRSTPEKSALECLGADGDIIECLTYAELERAVLGTATGLAARGVAAGDKVVLRLGNSSDFPIVFLAAAALGAVPVPTAAALTDREFATLVSILGGANLVVLGEDLPVSDLKTPVLRQSELQAMRNLPAATLAATKADDPGYIVFTSGSSGTPKGVVHAHRAVWARRMMWDGWYGIGGSDRLLHAGAFNWTFTLGTGLMDPWAIGATALIYAGPPDPQIWPQIAQRHAPTLFAAAPGIFRQITNRDGGGAFRGLRHALTAGEMLAEDTSQAWQAQSGRPIFEALGMSEVSTYISSGPATPPRPGFAGRPQKGRAVAVLGQDGQPVQHNHEGLLAVHRRDPGLMLGYYKDGDQPDLPLAGHWFVTGDRARMDDKGYVTFCGRSDDLMNAGGFRVSPLEVEATLARHPAITEAAVCTVSPKPGTTIIAAFFVSSAPVAEPELDAYVAAQLARHKQPRIWLRVETLPKRANGKLDRMALPQLWKADLR